MNKLNIPEAEDAPKEMKIVEMEFEHPQEEALCFVCGKQHYEWGHTEGLVLEHYTPGPPSGLLSGKEYIRVRRCLECNNLQLFHINPATS